MFRLRQRVGGLDIEHRAPGYVLAIDESSLDAHAFERALSAGAALRHGDPGGALEQVDAALALWRGEPFSDLIESDDGRAEAERLTELRLQALETRFALLVDLGRSSDAIADLEAFVAREPLRETARRVLIDALELQGRRAEALRVYDTYRRLLAEELGVAPSPDLAHAPRGAARGG